MEKEKISAPVDSLPNDSPGQRIKHLLGRYGWTQRELAEKLCKTAEPTKAQYSNLNAKLNGKRTITKSDAENIAMAFDVTPSFILYGGRHSTDLLFAVFQCLGYGIEMHEKAVVIRYDSKRATLQPEQINKLEDIILRHSEITIRSFMEAWGKEC